MYDYKHFNNISGFSVFSNNHESNLNKYHPPKAIGLQHESTLKHYQAKDIVKIESVSSPDWDGKSQKIMHGLDLKVSRLDTNGVVTEVSSNRLNESITGPYILDSYHVKVEYFSGLKIYVEKLGWMKLSEIKGIKPQEQTDFDFKGHTTGLIDNKLYYFNLLNVINLDLLKEQEDLIEKPDTFLVEEFFTTDWYWLQNQK